MAKVNYKNGVTSVILRVKIHNTSVTTGAGLTGLTSGSSGLIVSTIADTEATATAYTGSNLETITTLGTWANPTSGKARFKEVGATNHPGIYEVQLANTRWAVSGARSIIVSVLGATNAAQVDAEIQLEPSPANIVQIDDDTHAPENLALMYAGGIANGTVDSVVDNGEFAGDGADLVAVDDVYNNMILVFVNGDNKFIPRIIQDYVGSTKTFIFNGVGFAGEFPRTVGTQESFLILAGSP